MHIKLFNYFTPKCNGINKAQTNAVPLRDAITFNGKKGTFKEAEDSFEKTKKAVEEHFDEPTDAEMAEFEKKKYMPDTPLDEDEFIPPDMREDADKEFEEKLFLDNLLNIFNT